MFFGQESGIHTIAQRAKLLHTCAVLTRLYPNESMQLRVRANTVQFLSGPRQTAASGADADAPENESFDDHSIGPDEKEVPF